MTVFQQVLWMFVNIRVLGRQPRLPLPRESLIQYAVALNLQYSRICIRLGTEHRHEAGAIARRSLAFSG
jgi:hypothetical protein